MERLPPKKMAQRLARILKRQRPDPLYVKKVFQHVRAELSLGGPSSVPKKLPELLTDKEMTRFYETVWDASDRTHTILIKLLLFTGMRNFELANLVLEDVDIKACTIRINQGKGHKDRYVPFPESFRGELAQFMKGQDARHAHYLFETNRLDKFTTRWIRAIIKRYAIQAGIQKRIYPHLFRHQLLTFLAKKGIVDSKLQVISGHQARQNLALYQELSLVDIAEEYQDAMQEFPVR